MYILLRAYQPGLFDTTVPVKGHVTRTGTVVAPYQAKRKKRPEDPTPDLFAQKPVTPPAPAPTPKPDLPPAPAPAPEPEPKPDPTPPKEPEPEPDPYQDAREIMRLTESEEGIAGGWSKTQITHAYLDQIGIGMPAKAMKQGLISLEPGTRFYCVLNPPKGKPKKGDKTVADHYEDLFKQRQNNLKDVYTDTTGNDVLRGIKVFPDYDHAKTQVVLQPGTQGFTVEMVLGREAKIISMPQLRLQLMREFETDSLYEEIAKKPKDAFTLDNALFEKVRDREQLKRFFQQDLTRYAALRGYDAVTVSKEEAFIINREHLIVNTDILTNTREDSIGVDAEAGAKQLGFKVENTSGLFGEGYKSSIIIKGNKQSVTGWLLANHLDDVLVIWNTRFKGALIPDHLVKDALKALEDPKTVDQAYNDEVRNGIDFLDSIIPGDTARLLELRRQLSGSDIDDRDNAQDELDLLMGEILSRLKADHQDQNYQKNVDEKLSTVMDKTNQHVLTDHNPDKRGLLPELSRTFKSFLNMAGGNIPLSRFKFADKERGDCSFDGKEINLPQKNPKKITIFHECGHSVEDGNKEVRHIAQLYIHQRVTDWKLVSMNTLTGANSYRENELGYKGRCLHPYMLKYYESGSTEVIAMGMEKLSTRDQAVEFFTDDTEHFFLTMAAIASNRKRSAS